MSFREQLNQLGTGVGNLTGVAGSPLFASLGARALESLEPELSCVRLKSGETLFSEGERGDALYVVAFGRLRAFLRRDLKKDQVLGEIGRGEAVGEMALLTGEPRSATVRAIRDTALVRLSKAGFERVVEQHPQVMLEMARLIVTRYQRHIRPAAASQPTALAVVPCDAGVPVAEFAAGFVRALAPGRKLLALDLERLRRERGIPRDAPSDDLESADLASWLHEQELQHELLIYVADARPSAWTRLCVRQADMVLLVGSGGAATALEPGLVEILGSGAADTGARRELVLLYDSGRALPAGTADWLARLQVGAHHHLDPRQPRHYERLARMLTGRAIGLVLGGGGARGLAHIGVIRALEEAGIPIDLVGGTSSGSIIAGQFASGWDSARILAESRRVLIEDGSLNDFTLPLIALLRGNRYIRMLEKLYGDRCIEDLPLNFFCVSTNLSRSKPMVHRSGLLYRGVAASCAVPGLGPPRTEGRDVLVDGGIVNNLPVDIMRALGRGPVFASSVSPRKDLYLDRPYSVMPSPWRLLVNWLNPVGPRMAVPSMATILLRTASLQQVSAGQTPDLLVEPSGSEYRMLDWHALDAIAEAGYRAAVPAFERWQVQQSMESVAQ